MRELSLNEIKVISGAGPASDVMDTTARGATYGFTAGSVGAAAFRGAAVGARVGVYGAIVGGVIGLGVGIYDFMHEKEK